MIRSLGNRIFALCAEPRAEVLGEGLLPCRGSSAIRRERRLPLGVAERAPELGGRAAVFEGEAEHGRIA